MTVKCFKVQAAGYLQTLLWTSHTNTFIKISLKWLYNLKRFPALPKNIRLGWKWQKVPNSQAYCNNEQNYDRKIFMALPTGLLVDVQKKGVRFGQKAICCFAVRRLVCRLGIYKTSYDNLTNIIVQWCLNCKVDDLKSHIHLWDKDPQPKLWS